MTLFYARGSMPWASAMSVALAIAVRSDAGVRIFDVDWGPSAATESLYISINDLAVGPTSSGSLVAGWDMQIESSGSGSELKFNFPPFSGPVNPSNPNPYYGLMRMPGVTSGPGASLPFGTAVTGASSFADSGPVTFGGGSGQWRLNAINYFGFRFRISSASTAPLYYGFGKISIGQTAGQFRVLQISYQDIPGASLTVIPGPGAVAGMAVAVVLGRRGRRR